MRTSGNDSVASTTSGLTKREHFAIEIAKAIETRAGETQYQARFDSQKVAERAVKLADLLIEELNKAK